MRLARLIRALVVFEVILFLVPALLHAGVSIPLGFAELDEPVIVPAAIVEGLIGVAFAVAGFAVFVRAGWAWSGAVTAHVFALAGTLLGVVATFAGAGERTTFNTAVHVVMLVVVIAGLAWLLTAAGNAALGRRSNARASRRPSPRDHRPLESR